MGRNLPFAKQTFNSLSKRVLLGCALLALMIKVLIPAGFMLAQNSTSHLVAVVICTGTGSQTLFMNEAGQYVSNTEEQNDHGGGGEAPEDHPCTFAYHGAAALASITPKVEAVAFARIKDQVALTRIDQAPGRGLAAPPPPSTASPLLI